jgi:AraC family transcriptional regulator of adaptative response/methylated-DNA-[protein]-cysteine methyltransferase
MTPSTYRKGAPGMEIGYSIVQTRLGRLLVAATAKGVCSVSLGDDDTELAASLQREFSAAKISQNDDALRDYAQSIVAHLEGAPTRLNLPLDVRATAFQWRVWQALREISYGETRSYAQVAQSIGSPTAVRAVARACATNPVALLVPCHRVLRGDGKPSGYRWGLERKERLLELEQASLAETKAERHTEIG